MNDDARDPFADGLPVLRHERLVLRAFAPRDVDDVFELYRDKDATRFGYSPRMDTRSDAEHVISECARLARAREIFHWGVARASDDRIVGHATLFAWKREHRRAELGYSTLKSEWGRGLATAAAGVLLAFAFEKLDLRRIEADVDPRNAASLRVLEKLGFRREGLMRERWEVDGELQDAVILGLLRGECALAGERVA